MKLCPVQIKTNIMKKEPVGKDLHRSTQMFETFPLELLDSVVTENGRLHEKELKELFASWQVDERLLR
jgi:translation initiation factor 2B subunit (eIF-2B alpha/beta/delta family)